MGRILFVVSDVHGFYTAMKKALDEAGFDPKNPNHWFVSAGDLFDRGTENRKVYDYVRDLPRKLLIRGNHEDRLDAILTARRIEAYDESNRTADTVRELFGENVIDGNGQVWVFGQDPFLRELREFLDSMTDYYENDAVVITHGWIPFDNSERTPKMLENWRDAGREAWESARWQGWEQMYETDIRAEGKIIVCGHRPARLAQRFDQSRIQDDGIFCGNGVLVLDGYTVRSGRVNVLMLEETENG